MRTQKQKTYIRNLMSVSYGHIHLKDGEVPYFMKIQVIDQPLQVFYKFLPRKTIR